MKSRAIIYLITGILIMTLVLYYCIFVLYQKHNELNHSISLVSILDVEKIPLGSRIMNNENQFWNARIIPPDKISVDKIIGIQNAVHAIYNNPSDRARNRSLSPKLRNEAMEVLSKRCSDSDINELLSILTDKSENEVMASWGAQQIGCSWQRMTAYQIETARSTLITVLRSDSKTRLPQRESLFALSRLNDDESKIVIIKYIKSHIYLDNDSELDNIVRVVGIMRLHEFKDRVLALCGHKMIQVSGAAKEAIIALESKG